MDRSRTTDRSQHSAHGYTASRLGSLHDAAGHKDQAIRWYQMAAERDNTEAMTNLAVLIEDDDREMALRWTREPSPSAPNSRPTTTCIFLEEDGLLEEAEHYYRRAAQVAYPAARNRLAGLLKKAGRPAEAETWYCRTLDERADSCDDSNRTAATSARYQEPECSRQQRRQQQRQPTTATSTPRPPPDLGGQHRCRLIVTPEKRKIGGSTPPLPTAPDQRRKPREHEFSGLSCDSNATANDRPPYRAAAVADSLRHEIMAEAPRDREVVEAIGSVPV